MAAVTAVFNTLQVHIVADRGRSLIIVLYRGELVKMFNQPLYYIITTGWQKINVWLSAG